MIRNKKILVTGVTGTVAKPVAQALAADNDVWGLARFSDGHVREELTGEGITCVRFDFMAPDFDAVPDDVDHVLHFGLARGLSPLDFDGHLQGRRGDWRSPAGPLPPGSVVPALLFDLDLPAEFRTTAEIGAAGGQPPGPQSDVQQDKIAAEAVIRAAARIFDVPTTIARLNVPYGDNGACLPLPRPAR